MRLRELAAVRFGYRRLTVLLRRDGWRVNAKRIYRLYTEEGLTVRTKMRVRAVRRCGDLNRSRAGQFLRSRLAYIRGAGQQHVDQPNRWPKLWGQVNANSRGFFSSGCPGRTVNTVNQTLPLMKTFPVGGIPQWILVRATNPHAPALSSYTGARAPS